MHSKEFEQKQAFQKGLRLFKRKQFARAYKAFKWAVEVQNATDLHAIDPLCLSYYGLTLSWVKRDYKTGEKLCRTAARSGQEYPEVFANLSSVLELGGRKRQAVQMLRIGYRLHPSNDLLLGALQKLNPRSRVTFPFLDRQHVLNKFSGKLIHRMFEKPARSRSTK